MAEYYVATNGSDSNNGSFASPWGTLQYSCNRLVAGDTLYIRSGVYFSTGIYGNGSYNVLYISSRTGTSSNPINIKAYPGESVIVDGTNLSGTGQRNGIQISYCSYVNIKGITVRNVHEYTTSSPNNPAEGWYGESNNYITFDTCVSTKNGNGFRMHDACNYIYYINCDAYDNWDYFGWYSSGGAGGYADGFRCNIAAGAHQFFTGCRSWSNSDDGWDHMAGGGYTVFYNCWSFHNGASISGTAGDGDGFKLGYTTRGNESGFQRSLYNCISAYNGAIGFDESMDVGTAMQMQLYNCIAYSNTNDAGFRFANTAGTSATTLRNNIAYLNGPTNNRNYEGRVRNTEDHNSWDGGVTANTADFVSVEVAQLSAARKADGSLPDITAFHLVSGSDLIGKGVTITGNPTDGEGKSWATTPSLGPFEYNTTTSVAPSVTTITTTSITTTTASSGGNVTSDGGATVTARGVVWDTSSTPTIALSTKTSNGTGTGGFTSSITGLTSGTQYYVRAYATNNVGTSYGATNTFTTTGSVVLPTVTTSVITNIMSNSASGGGNVTSAGNGVVTNRGVCIGTSANPTTSGSITVDGSGTGSYISVMTSLIANTLYHVRAYAINSAGTAYGSDVQFTTLPSAGIPTLTTDVISDITQTTATGGGSITADGGASITSRGVVWSTTTSPTNALSTKTSNGTGTGSYTSSIIGLTGNTVYYVRAYAINSVGTAYGEEVLFTSSPVLSTVSINSSSNITSSSASVTSTVTSDGGDTVTERGVAYSTSSSPIIAGSHAVSGNGTGAYTVSLTGLLPSTTYYIRAYSINSVGTSYSTQSSFTTHAIVPPPVILVSSISVIGASNATTITTKGGTLQMNAIISPTSATTQVVTWLVLNGTGSASINSSGVLTAITDGTVTVRATSTDGSNVHGDVVITISNQIILVTLIEARGANNVLTINTRGGTLQMVRDIWPSNATNKTVIWSITSGGSSATISTSGLLTALTNGSVTVRATATDGSGVYDDVVVTINNQDYYFVDSITITSPGGVSIITTHSGTLQLYASITPPYATDTDVKWTIANGSGTAIISSSGLVTAGDNGTVIVTATALDGSGTSDTFDITINVSIPVPPSVSICPDGWHIPTTEEFDTLRNSLGGWATAGGHLKKTGIIYWYDPNEGADNISGFTGIGSGFRTPDGVFQNIRAIAFFHSSDDYQDGLGYGMYLHYATATSATWASSVSGAVQKHYGALIRLIKDDSTDPGTLTDYDGNVYETVKIGDQVWMKSDLKVEHYTDGTPIPIIRDADEWAAATTGAMCYYNNIK